MECPSMIGFDHLYGITDQISVSTYERSLIVNFYILIRSLNESCDIQTYKSEERNLALKDVITGFLHTSINNFEQLHKNNLSPSNFCQVTNDCVASLNNNLEKLATHFNLKSYHRLVKFERENDWISPRSKSNWDVQYQFIKKKI